jgi:sugar fermentation stimulation protein A
MVALPRPLIEGTLVRRYKRFMADVKLTDGHVVTAHVANPGSMMGLKDPGLRVWLSHTDNPKRKLAYSWELAEVNGTLVGVNAARANAVAAEALDQGQIPELGGYTAIQREVKYGRNSRIDLKLDGAMDGGPCCYVEVKNVHLHRGNALAEFPDAVTGRGTKHLDELADMAAAGHRAVMLYVVQRGDCDRLAIAADIDPAYASGLRRARNAGLAAYAYACVVTRTAIAVDRRLPIAL